MNPRNRVVGAGRGGRSLSGDDDGELALRAVSAGVGGRSGGASPGGKSRVRSAVSASRPNGFGGLVGGISLPNIGPIGVF